MSDRSSGASWDRFWFTPVDPRSLGLIRLLAGTLMVYTHAVYGLRLAEFLGPDAWLTQDLRVPAASHLTFSFWWWVPENYLWPAHLAALAGLILFAAGAWTRVTSVLAFVIVMSYTNRVPAARFGLDQITSVLTFYLMLSPSGAAWSFDSWRRRRLRGADRDAGAPGPSVAANVSLRLIRIHLCIIYFAAGTAKLQGVTWWTGEAIWNTIANAEYQTIDLTWLVWHPWIMDLIAHTTIAWEISFVALVWFRRTRPLVLLGGVAMHIGIGACLGMWTFALMMIIPYIAFAGPDWFGLAKEAAGDGSGNRPRSGRQEQGRQRLAA